ncbi:OmpL47-type beta-barrel domain-containing protein [Mesobacillus jeotgali]|uniref:OmpL47-type beta-barrel domain-containing protein n=1 Tax=Mesobacillus jeotgali TaxID=129985 RepID=UPI000C83E3B6|nr:fibronectin type III domain-containing protein [Mesobacillus jeotgali]
MKGLFSRKLTLLAVILIVSQSFFPLVNAFAASTALPPSNLAAQYVTPDDVKLTWSAVYGATGYNVYEITEGQLLLRDKTTAPSYTLNNLAEGSYRYVVSTLTSEGESGPSAPVSVEVVYPSMSEPSAPTYSVTNGNDLTLTWAAVQYAEKYNLYQISEDGEQTLISSLAARTYKITNMPEGKYSFAISASNSLYGDSVLSQQVTVDLLLPEMSVPNNFTYSLSNGSDITLKWNSVAYATNYNLYEFSDNEKSLKSTVNGTSIKLTGLSAGEYNYEIRSNSDRFGESAEGSQLKVVIGDVIMEAPGSLVYKLQNVNDIVLTWNTVQNANTYKVYQQVNGEKVLKSTVSGTTVTFPNALEGEHVYEIHSYSNIYGESGNGTKVIVPVVHPVMLPPENMTGTVKDDKDITLTWNIADNATNYKVYQIIDGKKVLKTTTTATSVTYFNLPSDEYSYVVHSYSSRFGESAEGAKLTVTVNGKTMLAPSDLTHTVTNGNDVKLSWSSAENATNYKIYQVIGGEKVLKNTITGTSIIYSNLPEGDYQYIVHSNSSLFGESENGAEVKFSLVYPEMGTPEEVTYKINNGNDFALNWTSVQYATSYKIYEIVDNEKILKYTGSALSTTIPKLSVGEHSYVVHSFSSRFGESPEGKKLSVIIDEYTMEAPDNLTDSLTNINTLTLKWDASLYVDRYKIYEVIDGERVLKATVTGASASISNITEGNHQYQVHSHSDRFGESPEGTSVTVNIVFPEIQAPKNLTNTIINGNDIVLKWQAADYATSYKVYENIDGQKILRTTVYSASATLVNVTEGKHSYSIETISTRFGESAEKSEISVGVIFPDMQAPENLSKTIVNGNDISLKWDASLYATSYKIYQLINGEKILKTTVAGTTAVLANMPEGEYFFEVHSFSSRFGESIEGTKVSFELIFPIMQSPDNLNQSTSNGNDIVLRWNSASYATAYKVYGVVNGQKELLRTVTGTVASFPNMPEGEYTYEVHSFSSRFSESPKSSEISFKLTWPVVQPPKVSGTVFNVNNMTLTWPSVAWANEYRVYKITDDKKELIYKGTALSYKIYNLSEDTHSFEVTAYSSRFGESVSSNQITETIVYPVMEAPIATLKVISETIARISWDFVTYANGYNIYELINGKPVLVAEKVNNLSYTLSNLTYANHLYYVTSYSNSFGESNPSETVLAKLIIDEESPITTSDVKPDWTNKTAMVRLTPTDNETGVAATYYSLDGKKFLEGTSFTVENEGVHEISFYSIDKVGNKEEVQTVEVKIDQTKPQTESDLTGEWSKENVAVKLTAEDILSGTAKTFYSVDGSEYTEGTEFIVTGDGIHEIMYYSIDHAGNAEEAQAEKVKIDTKAPETDSNIEDKWYQDAIKVELSANDNLSGVAATFYSLDGIRFFESTELLLEKDGIYTVAYYSVDAAGNIEAAKTQTVKIDRQAPETSANNSEEWYKENAEIVLTTEDNFSGIAKTFYSVNGSEFTEGKSFTVSEEGLNEVSYYSVDYAGNIEAQKTIIVKVDKTAPTVKVEVNEEYRLGSAFTVSYTAEDEHSGVAVEEADINGVKYKNSDSIILDQPGAYTFKVTVTDHAGWTTTFEKEFIVYIPVTLEVLPKVIKGNKGIFTVKAILPEGFAESSFKISTVTLNGVAPVLSNNGLKKQSEKGHFKFEREDFDWEPGKVNLELRAYLENGYLVKGSEIVTVK